MAYKKHGKGKQDNMKCYTNEELKKLLGSHHTQSKEEIVLLYRLLQGLSFRGGEIKTILEIGVAEGGSSNVWANFLGKDGLLIGVDAHLDICTLDPSKFECQVELIHSMSALAKEKVVDVLGKAGKEKIDFLFIDASHDYKDVKLDYELYSPLVRNNGVIAFHDFVSSQGVNDFIHELKVPNLVMLINFDVAYIIKTTLGKQRREYWLRNKIKEK